MAERAADIRIKQWHCTWGIRLARGRAAPESDRIVGVRPRALVSACDDSGRAAETGRSGAGDGLSDIATSIAGEWMVSFGRANPWSSHTVTNGNGCSYMGARRYLARRVRPSSFLALPALAGSWAPLRRRSWSGMAASCASSVAWTRAPVHGLSSPGAARTHELTARARLFEVDSVVLIANQIRMYWWCSPSR
jgi:hypothetical protein